MAVKSKKDQIREAAENDLESFIRLVHPKRVLGSIHIEVLKWWTREGASTHQLLLMPRDHQKSAMVAYRVAWEIVRNPAIRVLYISSTSNLATKQLKFIKDILSSQIVKLYWPELVNQEEAKREKWTETEISVDHPKRKEENVRDPTIFTAGLTTNIVGLHCDVQVLDDVVTNETAYTAEGRGRVETQYSLLASIASTGSSQWIVGTRYHPKDLYNTLLTRRVAQYNDIGERVGEYALYECKQYVVEENGIFLWPKQRRSDGVWFGFDQSELEIKRAQYLDKLQFRAQYYNDPNDPEGAGIGRECFQYYEPKFLVRTGGQWNYKGRRLNVFAAIDFAYSLRDKSDYTAIVVIGVDSEFNYYVLEIDRFKTQLVSEYFKHILVLHQKWGFRKIRAEVTVAQASIVAELKQNYIRTHGLALAVEDDRPTRRDGDKEERIAAILQPKYNNRQMWHYYGGDCQTLEEELVLSHPPHDDIKDSLAKAIDTSVAPSLQRRVPTVADNGLYHNRFGGIV